MRNHEILATIMSLKVKTTESYVVDVFTIQDLNSSAQFFTSRPSKTGNGEIECPKVKNLFITGNQQE